MTVTDSILKVARKVTLTAPTFKATSRSEKYLNYKSTRRHVADNCNLQIVICYLLLKKETESSK